MKKECWCKEYHLDQVACECCQSGHKKVNTKWIDDVLQDYEESIPFQMRRPQPRRIPLRFVQPRSPIAADISEPGTIASEFLYIARRTYVIVGRHRITLLPEISYRTIDSLGPGQFLQTRPGPTWEILP